MTLALLLALVSVGVHKKEQHILDHTHIHSATELLVVGSSHSSRSAKGVDYTVVEIVGEIHYLWDPLGHLQHTSFCMGCHEKNANEIVKLINSMCSTSYKLGT